MYKRWLGVMVGFAFILNLIGCAPQGADTFMEATEAITPTKAEAEGTEPDTGYTTEDALEAQPQEPRLLESGDSYEIFEKTQAGFVLAYVVRLKGNTDKEYYFENRPAVERMDDEYLKISVKEEKGTITYFFNKYSHQLSQPYYDIVSAGDQLVAYMRGIYSIDYIYYVENNLVQCGLVVESIAQPNEYSEMFILNFTPLEKPQDAIRSCKIKDSQMTITYLSGPDKKEKTEVLALGKSIPEWQEAYYSLFSSDKYYYERCLLIDLDFDGIPELCDRSFGTGGEGTAHGVSYKNGKLVHFDFPLPVTSRFYNASGGHYFSKSLWVTRFYLLKDKITGKKLWLAYDATRDGWENMEYYWVIYDFNNITKPTVRPLLSVLESCYAEEEDDDMVYYGDYDIIVEGKKQPHVNYGDRGEILEQYSVPMWQAIFEKYDVIGHKQAEHCLAPCMANEDGSGFDIISFTIKMNSYYKHIIE